MIEQSGYNRLTRLVDFSFKKIDRIEKNVFDKMQNLERIALNNNNLIFVETRFIYLNNLKVLDLSSNLILTIYSYDFNGLDSLEELNLNLNSLESIEPHSFT